MQLEGGVALITGGAKRIGAALVESLAQRGVYVYFTYRNSTAEANALQAKILAQGGQVKAVPCDLAVPQSIEQLFTLIRENHSRLDLLINNASSFDASPQAQWSLSAWSEALDTNARGPFLAVNQALPLMRPFGGLIINLIDLLALKPRSGYLTHSVSKAALLALTRALALELGPKIRVNAICPGALLPPANADASTVDAIVDKSVLKVLGGVEPILKGVDYLVANDFVTGEILMVDGGAALHN